MYLFIYSYENMELISIYIDEHQQHLVMSTQQKHPSLRNPERGIRTTLSAHLLPPILQHGRFYSVRVYSGAIVVSRPIAREGRIAWLLPLFLLSCLRRELAGDRKPQHARIAASGTVHLPLSPGFVVFSCLSSRASYSYEFAPAAG